ncbi:hypothetical protein JCM5353_002510 [Sporobolomyces roseus]
MTSSSPPPRYLHPSLSLSINTSTLQVPQPFSPSPSRTLNSTPTSSCTTSYLDPGPTLSLKTLSLQQRNSPVQSIYSGSPQTPSPTDTIRTLRPPLPPTPGVLSEKSLLLRQEREQQQQRQIQSMASPLPSPVAQEVGGELEGKYEKIGGVEGRDINIDAQGYEGETPVGGGGENIPLYNDSPIDPPIQQLEKGRLLEVLGGRGGERSSDGDAGSSRSAEIGSRDHLERWRNEQVNLEGRKRVVRKRESLSSEMSRDSAGTAMSGSLNGRRGQGGSSAGTGGGSLVGMSDAEIAQRHFRLAQQHLEAAQRLAMAASHAPAPSAPPTTDSHDPSDIFSDDYRESSAASVTDYTESSYDHEDSGSSPICPQSYGAYQSTYHTMPHVQPHIRHQPSREDLYSEFGQLDLEQTKPLFEGKRSRSLSNVASPKSSTLSAPISSRGPPLSSPSPSAFDSRSLPNSSKFLPPPSHHQQGPQYPPRMSSQSQNRPRPRPSTAEQVTPRASHRQNGRPHTADQVTPRQAPSLPTPPPSRSSQGSVGQYQTSSATMMPSLYGGTLPQGMADRIGAQPRPRLQPQAQPQSQPQRYEEDPFELESSVGGYSEVGGYEETDVGSNDGMSDFHDAQSTYSHVTTATLPPYEYGGQSHSAPPPVPSIPPAFRHEQQAQPQYQQSYSNASLRPQTSFSSPLSQSTSSSYQAQHRNGEDEEDFHGFRPRLGYNSTAQQGQLRTPTTNPRNPYPITESAQWVPSRHPTISHPPSQSQPQPERLYAPPPTSSASQIQPHSYILGADGRPIPVYASLPPPPSSQSYQPPSQAQYNSPLAQQQYLSPQHSITRQPLPIHSQPLRFDHSLHIQPARSTAPPQAPSAQYSQPLSQFSLQPPTSAPSPPQQQQHAYHLPPPSTFTQPVVPHGVSLTSLAQPTYRPPSATSSTSSEHSNYSTAPSTFGFLSPGGMKGRLGGLAGHSLSLRKMVRSPHVRFKSPEPSIAETTNSGGTVKFATNDAGVGGGVGGGGGTGEEKMERSAKAMKQSLGMLL